MRGFPHTAGGKRHKGQRHEHRKQVHAARQRDDAKSRNAKVVRSHSPNTQAPVNTANILTTASDTPIIISVGKNKTENALSRSTAANSDSHPSRARRAAAAYRAGTARRIVKRNRRAPFSGTIAMIVGGSIR